MEPMRTEIETLEVKNEYVEVHARAVAQAAEIRLKVRFRRSSLATITQIRDLARDEVLRYLDPA
jgi:hypothetical protein